MNRRVDGLLILAFLLSAFQFFPRAHAQLWGWGEDPYFNLWHYEWIWRQLTDHGVLSVFQDSFWRTPIFGGQDLTLALSENQIFAALFSWPLRVQSGDGAWTLSLFGWLHFRALAVLAGRHIFLPERSNGSARAVHRFKRHVAGENHQISP